MHAAEREGLADVRLAATVRCIECHSNELLARKYDLPDRAGRSYTEDFHGETVQFLSQRAGAQARVLICSDCHGAHAVRQEGVPLAEVCLRCHQNGDSKLAGAWLGHAPVGPRNRPVIWLIRLFYYVLIPFVLAGLGLNIGFHLVDQRRKGARVLETPGIKRLRARLARKRDPAPATVVRFSRLERLEHLGAMTTFILLVVTGLPQTRPDLSAAQAIIGFFGGIGTARLIHRIAGFTFAALLILHVSRAVAAAIRRRRLPVMTPTRNDFLDTLHTVRHFVWGTPRPKTGKFDFAQKFEYWGLFLGGTLMSVTGLALVFDELITRILPGEAWAAFRVMHGLEATLAVLVVALWHFYGVILRPEIFPLDTSILTGKVTVDRLREEHRLEYERLFPHGPAA
ncbi:MAG: cytochrome b/b6 domain-containing protein [Gemmatimonadetes bacterium]|nr:cytochrome b/b6 domain-containing protein [Gemmatimonadota bacterium]